VVLNSEVLFNRRTNNIRNSGTGNEIISTDRFEGMPIYTLSQHINPKAELYSYFRVISRPLYSLAKYQCHKLSRAGSERNSEIGLVSCARGSLLQCRMRVIQSILLYISHGSGHGRSFSMPLCTLHCTTRNYCVEIVH
jgi:hypothetical protein